MGTIRKTHQDTPVLHNSNPEGIRTGVVVLVIRHLCQCLLCVGGALYFGKCLLFVSYKYTCSATLLEIQIVIIIIIRLMLATFFPIIGNPDVLSAERSFIE